jgi:hypothetical protein
LPPAGGWNSGTLPTFVWHSSLGLFPRSKKKEELKCQ